MKNAESEKVKFDGDTRKVTLRKPLFMTKKGIQDLPGNFCSES